MSVPISFELCLDMGFSGKGNFAQEILVAGGLESWVGAQTKIYKRASR